LLVGKRWVGGVLCDTILQNNSATNPIVIEFLLPLIITI
jgi:hypothetical protein